MTEQLERFITLLKGIFELDKSDLDFGIYRSAGFIPAIDRSMQVAYDHPAPLHKQIPYQYNGTKEYYMAKHILKTELNSMILKEKPVQQAVMDYFQFSKAYFTLENEKCRQKTGKFEREYRLLDRVIKRNERFFL